MQSFSNLAEYLISAEQAGHASSDLASVITALASAAKDIDHLVRRNGLGVDLGSEIGGTNADGDSQKALDVQSEEIIINHLMGKGAAALLSEEQEDPIPLNDKGRMIVAVDPLDGSSNISVNVTIGTIFSILPSEGDAKANRLQKGRQQLAAGFFTYGPQTNLIMCLAESDGVVSFTLSPDHKTEAAAEAFLKTGDAITIPHTTKEFAINSAYTNHWFKPVQEWMADVLAGQSGPLGQDYRMRWVGSLVSDAWRIFQRGGIFLYPADQRKGNETGRLRLVYEANPIALLAEKAGGKASNGHGAILDMMPVHLHQRVPLFFGASTEVERIEALHQKDSTV